MARSRTNAAPRAADPAVVPDRRFEAAVLGMFLVIYGVLLARPIDLVTADLGRHLKNGELFVTSFAIPRTNLYAYTYPDYPFVNHHWGTGVLFYLAERVVGFAGLHLLFMALTLGTFAICFRLARRRASFQSAALVSLPMLAILVTRPEVRPEGFSYLLSAIFLAQLWAFREGEIGARRLLALLPVLMLLWVNLHIYFFLGIVLIALFLAEEAIMPFLRRRGAALRMDRSKALGLTLALALAATLLNPSGLAGAIYPLRIFGNYGHAIIENQPLLWVEQNYGFPAGIYFKIAFALLVLGWGATLVLRRPLSPALLLLSVALSVLGWQAIRNFGLYGTLALPLTAVALEAPWRRLPPVLHRTGAFAALLVLAAGALYLLRPAYWTERGPIGIGVRPGSERAARFLDEHAIEGPIFNNYDVGGYLIRFLYPRERVFVDNRPEAYPAEFFTGTYVPMQEDPAEWERVRAKYGLNTIVFTRSSLAPRAVHFLQARANDPEWAAVYVDRLVAVLVRRNGPNASVIADYELCLAGYQRAAHGH